MKELNIQVMVFESLKNLPNDVRDLMNCAIKARHKAYAPYSKFNVGAAVLLDNGKIVLGNNQENAAYPSGMCAERVAIWNASSQFKNQKILKLALSANSDAKVIDNPIAPCGACRQTLLEYEIKQEQEIEVFFMGEVGKVIKVNSFSDLLPLAFDKTSL